MRSAFLAAACLAAANAQVAPQPAPGDALPLLREVAEAARATKNWRVEGRITVHSVSQSNEDDNVTPFKLVRDGLKWRYEVATAHTLSDGFRSWSVRQPATEYLEYAPPMGGAVRTPPVVFWDNLPEALPSARLAGEDTVEWGAVSERCQIVRADMRGGGQRSLCIDRERKLVLRDETETATHVTRTITLSVIERDSQPPPNAAEFQPPADAVIRLAPATEASRPAGAIPGNGVTPLQLPQPGPGAFRVGGGVTAPTLVHKVEPEYSEEARKAKFSGTVVLSVEVGPDGLAHNIQVLRSIGMGLDEKAVEAVQKWTFLPGKKDGVPVTVQATIEVNFRL